MKKYAALALLFAAGAAVAAQDDWLGPPAARDPALTQHTKDLKDPDLRPLWDREDRDSQTNGRQKPDKQKNAS